MSPLRLPCLAVQQQSVNQEICLSHASQSSSLFFTFPSLPSHPLCTTPLLTVDVPLATGGAIAAWAFCILKIAFAVCFGAHPTRLQLLRCCKRIRSHCHKAQWVVNWSFHLCVFVCVCTVVLLLLLLSLQLTLDLISLVAVLTIGAALIGALSLKARNQESAAQSNDWHTCTCTRVLHECIQNGKWINQSKKKREQISL